MIDGLSDNDGDVCEIKKFDADCEVLVDNLSVEEDRECEDASKIFYVACKMHDGHKRRQQKTEYENLRNKYCSAA